VVVPEADAIVRAADFFKPAWTVPEARASAAEEETQRQDTLENGRLDGEG
jgi:hypothetical protein